MSTLSTEDRALRMLAAGDSPTDISSATGPTDPAPADAPLTISRLLEEASGHSKVPVRKLAAKIENELDQLRTLIKTHEAEETARRAAAEEKARAKAEVERLERQLREAKAKLRGNPAPKAPAAEHVCPGCGKTYRYPKALATHQTTCDTA